MRLPRVSPAIKVTDLFTSVPKILSVRISPSPWVVVGVLVRLKIVERTLC